MLDLVQEYSLDQSTWTYKGFHGVLHTFFPVAGTGVSMHDFFGDGSSVTIFFVKDDYVHWYWKDDDLTRIREEFFRRLRQNPQYLEELKNEWKEKTQHFETICHKIDMVDLSAFSNDELASLYDRFYASYVDHFKYFMALGDAISMHADRYLVPEFQKVLDKDFTVVFPKLLSPTYRSFIEEEYKERERLRELFRANGSVDRNTLERHAKNFFYIQNNYARGIRLTADDFERLLQQDAKTITLPIPPTPTKEDLLAKKQQLIERYHLSPWHQTLLYLMNEFFYLQDTRKKYVLISNYYQFAFLREAERRSNIPFKLLQYSIYPEFRDVLKGTMDPQQFSERKRICVCIHTPRHYKVVSGAQAEKAFQFFQRKSEDTNELRGMVASVGIARGRVKKILKIHDMASIERGDILVASMTRPEMVPAMKFAAAIVTDEGGVTSHAAIVSRELGIPCIIGTKIATQVLHDGEMVEVDANNGIIKVIS